MVTETSVQLMRGTAVSKGACIPACLDIVCGTGYLLLATDSPTAILGLILGIGSAVLTIVFED